LIMVCAIQGLRDPEKLSFCCKTTKCVEWREHSSWNVSKKETSLFSRSHPESLNFASLVGNFITKLSKT
jgi:hypothetical protein